MAWSKSGNIKGADGAVGPAGVGSAGIQGPKGAAGAAGGAWHVGAGVPGSSVGNIGDMYYDSTASHVYSKTTGTNWSDLGSIKGVAGAGITIVSSLAATALPAGLGVTDAGNAYIITTAGDGGGITWAVGHLAVWDGTAWHDAGEIQGPAGIQGPPGAAGVGSPGAAGATPTFTVDATSVAVGGAPTIVAGATADSYVLGIPVGATGAPGPAGPAGTGSKGDAGVRGSKWFTGAGAPGTVAGAVAGDMYLDTSTGDVHELS